MSEFNSINRFDIEEKISGESLRFYRIISAALLIGPFIFLLIVLFLYQRDTTSLPDSESIELINLMILAFIVIAFSIYSLAIIFPKIFLKKENIKRQLSSVALQKQSQNNDPVLKLIGVDRTLMIIRLAMLEGVTLFAFVILMLGVQNHAINANEAYWMLLLPWFVQLFFTVNYYFSKDRIVERIYNEILSKVKDEL